MRYHIKPFHKAFLFPFVSFCSFILYLSLTSDLVGGIELLSILFTFSSGIMFASDKIPIMKGWVSPTELQSGWEKLVSTQSINHDDPGFKEISTIVEYRYQSSLEEIVRKDLSESEIKYPVWENIEQISVKNRMGHGDWICIQYEENSAPYSSSDQNSSLTALREMLGDSDRISGDGWRWLMPLSACQDTILKRTNDAISNHVQYGGVFLIGTIALQLLLFFFADEIRSYDISSLFFGLHRIFQYFTFWL